MTRRSLLGGFAAFFAPLANRVLVTPASALWRFSDRFSDAAWHVRLGSVAGSGGVGLRVLASQPLLLRSP